MWLIRFMNNKKTIMKQKSGARRNSCDNFHARGCLSCMPRFELCDNAVSRHPCVGITCVGITMNPTVASALRKSNQSLLCGLINRKILTPLSKIGRLEFICTMFKINLKKYDLKILDYLFSNFSCKF